MARMMGLSGALCVAVALVSGCGKVELGATPFSVSRVGVGHPAVASLLGRLNSSAPLAADLFILSSSGTTDAGRSMAQRSADQVNQMRGGLAKDAKYEFVDALEFRVPSRQNRPVIYPVEGETSQHPSVFGLAPGHVRQVYVLCTVKDKNGVDNAYHCLLARVGAEWKMAVLWIKRHNYGRLTFDEALSSAAREEKAGNLLLARGLYEHAAFIAAGPPFRTTGMQQKLRPAYEAFVGRLRRRTGPLDTLPTSVGQLEVREVRTVDTIGGPYLGIWYDVPKLDPPEVENARQEEVARACLKKHARVKDYFAGIAVHAVISAGRRKGQGYRTAFSIADLEKEASQRRPR